MKNLIKTFKIIIEYDGSNYSGWQRQNKNISIQGEIEKALSLMTCQKVILIGSGRTDAGVHAFGQVASFKVKTRLTADDFNRGLNSLTSRDIVIHSCESVPNYFHARFDAKLKTYRYYILNNYLPSAIKRSFVWHISKKLNIKSLALAASYFVGIHDFKTFEGAGSPRNNTVRTITKSYIKHYKSNNLIIYTVEGNGFLRFMVRNIVGTLVDVGLGKIEAKQIPKLIDSKDRTKAGLTAPSHGLFLVNVIYLLIVFIFSTCSL